MLGCRRERDNKDKRGPMGRTYKAGVCALALAALAATNADAKHRIGRLSGDCAHPEEVTAIQATSIQQELMVAALTCNEISNYNAFQTSFSTELRASDRNLLRL